ncbi:MAG: hypothetical protein WCK49_04310 [Myxococcaceae bacterium]
MTNNLFREIQSDPILRIYGAFVSLFLTLTALHWILSNAAHVASHDSEAICWAMFENCALFRVLGIQQLIWLFYGLGFMSLVTAVLFLFPSRVQTAYWMLLGLNIMKHMIIFLDYRLRLNQHIMAFWVTAVFLFLPHKKVAIRILIILFYFWSGILKLNPEWFSGAALYIKPWLFEGPWLPIACIYVVILEILFVWGLLWDRSKIAWAVFAQLILFHIFSFKIVGFYYPVLMFLMISIFPLCWFLEKESSWKISTSVLVVAVLFSSLQIFSKTFPGDTAITGEGRLFSLHMFDSLTQCEARAEIKLTDGRVFHKNIEFPTSARTRCDPLVYLNRVRTLCSYGKLNPAFSNIDWSLKTKHSIERDLKTVVDIKDFCSKPIEYAVFKHNDWIRD